MNITLLKGSANAGGSSDTLAGMFAKGAEETGHKLKDFYVAKMNIHPCIGCGKCGMDGQCVFKDDNRDIKDALLNCDMAVFVTPIYYFGMTAQLKAVIDRFYSYTVKLSSRRLKTALITAAWDANDDVMPYTVEHYKKLCRYMNFEDMGMVLGKGCGTPAMTKRSPYMNAAYELGKNI